MIPDRPLNILWKGPVFNPTGIATASREMIKALIKLGHRVKTLDLCDPKFEFNRGLESCNDYINPSSIDFTVIADYPQNWNDSYGLRGEVVTHFVHEGTKLWPGWAETINQFPGKFFVPSQATKNLFKWNGVIKKIDVINFGANELYQERQIDRPKEFMFLSVNSWTGKLGDRKGTELIIKAFDEEFKGDPNVQLFLKISTFWDNKDPIYYQRAILDILGHENPSILFSSAYAEEEKLAEYYNICDVFVAPTRGEGFGLTILNSLASGLPVITTKDGNSGHMDFCKNNPGVIFVNSNKSVQGDRRFYVEGNLLAEPDLEDLKKQMRWAYENRDKLKNLGKEGKEFVKDFKWENSAKKLIEVVYGEQIS